MDTNPMNTASVLARMEKEKAFLRMIRKQKNKAYRRKRDGEVLKLIEEAAAALDGPEIEATISDVDRALESTLPERDIREVRIDDFEGLFRNRNQLSTTLKRRIELICAKMMSKKKDGKLSFFAKAFRQRRVPVDKALCIYAHMEAGYTGIDVGVDRWVRPLIECGLYSWVHNGIEMYMRRCNRAQCSLCNYLRPDGGLKVLLESYDEHCFWKGGNWFEITLAPRRIGSEGVLLNGKAFRWPSGLEQEDFNDTLVQAEIRSFLGTCMRGMSLLHKNHWLDGFRGKVEDCPDFMPYRTHHHWHFVASSTRHTDTDQMQRFLEGEINSELAALSSTVRVDVEIRRINDSEDLSRWVKYMTKESWLNKGVDSVYNRYPGIGKNPRQLQQFLNEIRAWWQREKYIFKFRALALATPGRNEYNVRRVYCVGNHKFGSDSILSESRWHESHRRARAKAASEKRSDHWCERKLKIKELLEERRVLGWPQKSLTAGDWRLFASSKASATMALNRGVRERMFRYRKFRPANSKGALKHYVLAEDLPASIQKIKVA